MPTLRAVVFLVFQIVSLCIWASLTILIGPFLPYHPRYRFAMTWCRMMIWASRSILGIRANVIGTENLPDGPAIILSKHESAWETMFYPAFFERDLCFVFKRELLWIPFFGWGITLLRMVAINRSQGNEAFQQVLDQGQDVLHKQGRWMVFFPEGTRVLPGQHRRYKTGGARLAIATKTPIIPIAMNSGDLWPRKSFLKKPGVITVSIGPTLLPDGEDATNLTTKVETWIEQEMQRISPGRSGKAHQ